jgi:type VI secretion system protein ImpM
MYALYGKLPAAGDFLVRGLQRDVQQAIDDWLACGMLALQQAADDWLERYLVAPVWTFVAPAGRLSAEAVAGALMPSVDRVGRYFPLIVLRPLDGPATADQAQALCGELQRVAAVLPGALHETLGAEALLERVDECSERRHRPDLAAAPVAGAIGNARLLAPYRAAGDVSVWWSLAAPPAPMRYLTHRGRVDTELFVELYCGQ